MAYVAANYLVSFTAPLGKWVCARTSKFGPYDTRPPDDKRGHPEYCGQCVSYVTTVCTTLSVSTTNWKKEKPVKGNSDILPGTAIATFIEDSVTKEWRYPGHDDNKKGIYGHAAIYEGQTVDGIKVVDQWVFEAPGSPAMPIHQRMLRFGAKGFVNNGENFYIIE